MVAKLRYILLVFLMIRAIIEKLKDFHMQSTRVYIIHLTVINLTICLYNSLNATWLVWPSKGLYALMQPGSYGFGKDYIH